MTVVRLKRPTQKEVAQRAGVSQAVVSQVLTGRESGIRLTQETRERVLGAMRDLGYVPNAAAQRLAGGYNRLLGVFTYEPVFPSSGRDFYFPFLEGIEEEAAALDYDLLLHTRPATKDGERRLYHDGASRLNLADGTLMLGVLNEARRTELARLLSEGHPVVFIGRRDWPDATLTFVAADYARATADALRRLLDCGHRRSAYLGERSLHESAVDRESGYREELTRSGTAGQVLRVEHVTTALVEQLQQEGTTALLLENDRLARSWLKHSAALGLEVPRDFSFVVLGDPLEDHSAAPPWASFHIPRREMGRQAVRLLAGALVGQPTTSVTLACRWVAGPTIGQVPG